tara:strand:+ start:105 stop:266 length:162 start_codon:yes stop_codon:yes gene_type:complete
VNIIVPNIEIIKKVNIIKIINRIINAGTDAIAHLIINFTIDIKGISKFMILTG